MGNGGSRSVAGVTAINTANARKATATTQRKTGAKAGTKAPATKVATPSATKAKSAAKTKAPAQPPRTPTTEELKAAAEQRLKTAKTEAAKAERAYKAAEKAAAQKRTTNAAEIEAAAAARNAAHEATYGRYSAARVAIAEERARAKGEAGKAPKTYAKMLAAEQPMKDAQARYAALKPISDASEAHRVALLDQYRVNYDMRQGNAFDRLRKDHPDYRAAERQAWKDDSATSKAQLAMWRKQGTYEGARNQLAGKISDANINAHPVYAGVLARQAAADARLGEATGDTALRAASNAREQARAELNDAQIALKHPAWNYTLHSEPIHAALYTSPEQWPAGTLQAARTAQTGHDRHLGDLALNELQRAQGFDAPPDIVTDAELSQHVKAGEVELWRGDTKSGHTDNFMMGEYHTGLGIRGNGTYAQEGTGDPRTGKHAEEVARGYAKSNGNDGLIMRMSLKNGSRVIDYPQLQSMARDAAQHAQRAEQRANAAGDKAAADQARALHWLATSDTSRYAVALGYDAVRVPDSGQWVILNRSALRISHQVHG